LVECLRRQSSVAGHLPRPRLPNQLSEGLAAIVLSRVYRIAVGPGARRVDLDCGGAAGQVKGTGPSQWALLTESDVRADLLVWVDYGERLITGRRAVDVYVIAAPGTRGLRPGRIHLPRVLATVGDDGAVAYRVDAITHRVTGVRRRSS